MCNIFFLYTSLETQNTTSLTFSETDSKAEDGMEVCLSHVLGWGFPPVSALPDYNLICNLFPPQLILFKFIH